ncbi:helix-turn-helix domain-containing protein [Dyadobacter fermentans]|uniref:Transcriptional regulator, XRE family n=1 Tax=Dyadobacter fermentans (strain ATCC 700827 / DSM 18053 / CIP 107007 / KCTC 52180 / NS114) TaxID=471854 RepID=C6W0T2_DYAFD|nr:helix-turn-helix transcriptional regulator [Dyadobacter fermentans]ACT93688.1 transcriptional regulator, XRE family [Dyadobacter fermentans DSM 18053]
MEAFAKNLREKRERKGFSAAHLASLLLISEEQYNDLENGHTSPSVGTLKQLSVILNSTVPELLTDRAVLELVHGQQAGHFTAESLSELDKDTYIKILENQLRTLLAEKKGTLS